MNPVSFNYASFFKISRFKGIDMSVILNMEEGTR